MRHSVSPGGSEGMFAGCVTLETRRIRCLDIAKVMSGVMWESGYMPRPILPRFQDQERIGWVIDEHWTLEPGRVATPASEWIVSDIERGAALYLPSEGTDFALCAATLVEGKPLEMRRYPEFIGSGVLRLHDGICERYRDGNTTTEARFYNSATMPDLVNRFMRTYNIETQVLAAQPVA